jgi:AcrR family transcriptional regulator
VPPKIRYPPEAVLAAAVEVVRHDGLASLSARTVARRLGSSTAPVSSAFPSMAALSDAVVAHLLGLLVSAVQAAEGPDPLRAAAYAFARFTADEPRFYEALFLHPHEVPPDWASVRRSFAEGLPDSRRFGHLSPRQADALAWRASVVTHGICIELWSGRYDRTDEASLRRVIDELIEPVVAARLG